MIKVVQKVKGVIGNPGTEMIHGWFIGSLTLTQTLSISTAVKRMAGQYELLKFSHYHYELLNFLPLYYYRQNKKD